MPECTIKLKQKRAELKKRQKQDEQELPERKFDHIVFDGLVTLIVETQQAVKHGTSISYVLVLEIDMQLGFYLRMGNIVSRRRHVIPCICCRTTVNENSEIDSSRRRCTYIGEENYISQFTTVRETELDNDEDFGFSKTEPNLDVKNRFRPLSKNTTIKGLDYSSRNFGKLCLVNREKNQRKTKKEKSITTQNSLPVAMPDIPNGLLKKEKSYTTPNSLPIALPVIPNNLLKKDHPDQSIVVNQYVYKPQASAMTFGNENTVKVSEQCKDYSSKHDNDMFHEKTIQYLEKIDRDGVLIRKQTAEILKRLDIVSTESKDYGESNGKMTSKSITTGKGSKRNRPNKRSASKDRNRNSIFRPKSNGSSRNENSFINNRKSQGLLQDMKWNQYETVQKSVLGKITCEVQKCESHDEVERKVVDIRSNLVSVIELRTSELEYSLGKSVTAKRRFHIDGDQQWRDKTVLCLHDHKQRIMRDADKQLQKLKSIREQEIQFTPVTNRKNLFHGIGTNKDSAKTAAESFITLLTNKVQDFVSALMPIDIQQEIIVFAFKCQKSFVLKSIMRDIATGNFVDCVQYILNPNEFARTWLRNFTNKKMFHHRINGKSFYAKLANQKVEEIFKIVGLCIEQSTSHNLPKWLDSFLKNMQNSNGLPLSSADLAPVFSQDYDDACMKTFKLFINSRLTNMKTGVVQTFINANENTVQTMADSHRKIVDSLWGCTMCCPFCHEPCFYTDPDHIKQGLPHRCIQHRPLGVYGFMDNNSNELVTENCNFLIQTSDKGYKFKTEENLRPCKDYKEEFGEWKIKPLTSNDESKYWIWFMCSRKEQLAQVYGGKEPCFPDEWIKCTMKDAISSLDPVYICS
ncbi:unnamed protein product [Mytilus coruscus]|uniref:Uncharacterized protein n=1 Tax=Mytilus coruscus TaxID=42192 RepID=A0A6J8A827_MYTCO|nr:unnamed protein product [Mytilus coruscus]